MGLIQALSDWLLAGVGGFVAVIGGYARQIDSKADTALDTAERNRRRLEGDPENPSDEGLMDLAFQTREKLDRMEIRMEREHREVMSKLEDISDGEFEADG